jgi:Na+-driven multidrug efflux pump
MQQPMLSHTEPQVYGHAVLGLRIVSAGFVFYAYGMVLTQAFNGAGDTATPTLLNLLCFWLLELPLAYVLAYPAGLGPTGGFLAITTAFVVLTLASALLFRRGKWKLRAL